MKHINIDEIDHTISCGTKSILLCVVCKKKTMHTTALRPYNYITVSEPAAQVREIKQNYLSV